MAEAKNAKRSSTSYSVQMLEEQTGESDIKDQFWVLPLPKWDRSDKTLKLSSLASKQTLKHVAVAGKRVLVRVDYNVPMKNGVIEDSSRVDCTLPTLNAILDPKRGQVKCVVLICHLGRPGGMFDTGKFSLRPVAEYLQTKLPGTNVRFLTECVGPSVEREINSCEPGTVFLLENLRFHIEETGKGVTAKGKKVKSKPEDVARFSEALTRLGDVFVFEAFGAAHRPHASVVGIDLPQRVAGKLMQRELKMFSQALGQPKRPVLAILGGAKVSDKIPVIKNMLNLVDEMIIGGGMTYTFKKVIDGVDIGGSLFDQDSAETVREIVSLAQEKKVKLHFASDHVVADDFNANANTQVVSDEQGIPDGWMALDVGPQTSARFTEVIDRANTVIWNGPLGVFEMPAFANGTEKAMQDVVRATRRGAITLIGGGDTGAASHKFSFEGKTVAEQVTHVSTGGGSSLVLLEGKSLPGVDHLSDQADQPPDVVDVKSLWMEVRALKNDNKELRLQLNAMQDKVAALSK